MRDYFKYIRKELKFLTKPNYSYLISLFRSALTDLNETEDFKFDWRCNVPKRRKSTGLNIGTGVRPSRKRNTWT